MNVEIDHIQYNVKINIIMYFLYIIYYMKIFKLKMLTFL